MLFASMGWVKTRFSIRCPSAGPKTEVSENFPDDLTRGVTIQLWADVVENQETLEFLFRWVNEAMEKTARE